MYNVHPIGPEWHTPMNCQNIMTVFWQLLKKKKIRYIQHFILVRKGFIFGICFWEESIDKDHCIFFFSCSYGIVILFLYLALLHSIKGRLITLLLSLSIFTATKCRCNRHKTVLGFKLQACLPVPIFAGHTDFGPQSRFPDFMRWCTDFGRCGNF